MPFDLGIDVLSGPILESEDLRHDYGERRLRAVGIAEGRLLVCIYTARGPGLYRIISLRPANRKERDANRAAYPG